MKQIIPRQITYLTGTRADYGLMLPTLRAFQADARLSLGLIVTGMHLSDRFGMTVSEIEEEGLPITARIPVDCDSSSCAAMASNIGYMLIEIVQVLQAQRPDSLVLLGDRGEMLAGAIAAAHLGVPIVHIHGGERSGTVDEPVRHAISKLANLHLVTTTTSRDRLIRMGEQGNFIHVVGAPGLDGLTDLATMSRAQLCGRVGLDPLRPVALLVFHPVLSEASEARQQILNLLEAAFLSGFQVVAVMPNSDAGSDEIRQVLQHESQAGHIVLYPHLPRSEFVSWMAVVDVMLGNSSSGILEAATFGTPVVNVGSRQNLRERNPNVIDVQGEVTETCAALELSQKLGRYSPSNLYGDGRSGQRIVELLASIDWASHSLTKSNAY